MRKEPIWTRVKKTIPSIWTNDFGHVLRDLGWSFLLQTIELFY
jgi:hypothetical protein